MTPTAGLLLGGRYELTERLAVGGMGEVWVATDLHLRRNVAAKVLRAEFAGDTHFLDRLRTEARNSAALSHQNIAAMYDYGEQRGSGYLIMELVIGESLEDLLRREHTLEPTQVLPILAQTARALHTAHMAGVVHRDVKPSNILLTRDGYVKITDFGISLGANQAPMTAAGMVMGTAQYLPPEQAMGRAATGAGDIYALGVVAFEVLTGRRPFTGTSQVDIAFAHVNQPVPELPAHLDERVRDVVMQMLAKDPERRPRSAASLARALETISEQLRAATEQDADEGPPATSVAVAVAARAPLQPAPESSSTPQQAPPQQAQHRATTDEQLAPGLSTGEHRRTLAEAARRGPVRQAASVGTEGTSEEDPAGEEDEVDELAPRWRRVSSTGIPPAAGEASAHALNATPAPSPSSSEANAGTSAPSPSGPAPSRRDLRSQSTAGGRAASQHRPTTVADRLGPRGRWAAIIGAALVLTALLVLLFSTLGAAASTSVAAVTVLAWPARPLKSRASERVEER